jgi:hypothetical protein
MATYYLDYENGNDANDGLSFANRWKTMTSGATAARIVPGDTIRIMGSPAPTSLGIGATWTGEKMRITGTITGATNASPIVCTLAAHGFSTGDTVNISAAAGNTAANGTWEVNVLTSSTFQLVGSAGNGAWVSGGTIRKINNRVVRLNSALTQNIASVGVGSTGGIRNTWTSADAVNVTTTTNTTAKEHYFSDSIAVGAGFVTGVAAYYPLPTTLDLSAYQQVSFWIYQRSGTIGAAGACSLVLCSDTAGAVGVNTIDIPQLGILSYWHPITVNVGVALSSSVRSIAFKVNTDNAAQTFYLNNIIACKAASSPDSLTLTSLIGKNTTGETWYGIQSINGTRVMLDDYVNSLPSNTIAGYFPMTGIGVTENVTTYKRETIKTTYATLISTQVQTFTTSGTAGNLICYEGGWDRTNMSTQTLETWFDGSNGNGYGIYNSGKSYVSLNNIAAVRYYANFYFTGIIDGMQIPYIPASNNSSQYGIFFNSVSASVGIQTSIGITTIGAVNNNYVYGIYYVSSYKIFIDNVKIFNTGPTYGLFVSSTYYTNKINSVSIYNNTNLPLYLSNVSNFIINNADIRNNAYYIQFLSSRNNTIGILTSINNSAYGIYFGSGSSNNFINGGSTSGNTSIGIQYGNIYDSNNYFKNFTVNESTEFSGINGSNHRLYSQNHDNTADNHVIFTDNGKISSETTVRNTASGLAWKLQPTSTSRDQYYPLDFSLAKVAVNANSLVSVACSMRRTNTGLALQLVVPGSNTTGGNTLGGIPAAGVIGSMTAAADTWEKVSLSFTPTETGVVEVLAYAWGGSTYTGYVDDLTITQA